MLHPHFLRNKHPPTHHQSLTLTKTSHSLAAQQYKQIKKVKEHHRKQRRELKKSGRKPKELKTVGPEIPSQWPFKEELLKEMAWKRQQVLLADKAKREERKRNREVSCSGLDCSSSSSWML